MKNAKKFIIRCLITSLCASMVSVLILILHGFYEEGTSLVEKYRILADAFTIPGVILIMVTALVWISTEGMFDGLSYAFGRVGSRIIPFFKKSYQHETFYDYKMSKEGKRAKGYSFLFWVGLLFVAVAAVFICLHASIYEPIT